MQAATKSLLFANTNNTSLEKYPRHEQDYLNYYCTNTPPQCKLLNKVLHLNTLVLLDKPKVVLFQCLDTIIILQAPSIGIENNVPTVVGTDQY